MKKINKCPLCDKQFPVPAKLIRHSRSHTGTKPFSCEKCGQNFSQFAHIKRHDQDIHMKIKNYKCEKCNIRFSQFNNYKIHSKRKHNILVFNKKINQIPIRDKKIMRKKKKHRKQIPICEECNYQLKSSKCLKKHLDDLHKSLKYFKHFIKINQKV